MSFLQRTLRTCLNVGVVLLLVSCAIFVTNYVQNDVDRKNSAICLTNMYRLSYAIHEYHEKYKHYPPAFTESKDKKRLHSWRILVLEFIDPALFGEVDLDLPWNHPVNHSILKKMPAVFRCPNDPDEHWLTRFVVVSGPSTLFHGSGFSNISDVKSNPSTTIMILESPKHQVQWMEPTDWDVELDGYLFSKAENSVNQQRGNGVVFLDGHLARLKEDIPLDHLKSMASIADGVLISREQVCRK